MLNVTSSKMTGIPGPSGYSQVHDFLPEDEEKRNLRGHLFAVISISKFEEGVAGVNSGREVISRLQEEYFGDLTSKPFNALSSAVTKVTEEFKEALGKIEVAALAIVNGVAYCACSGGGAVIILREGALASIIESPEGKTSSASGFPKGGDTMLLGTSKFFKKTPQGIMKAALESSDALGASESFARIFHSEEDSGDVGAAILKFEEENGEKTVVESEVKTAPRLPFKSPDLGKYKRAALSALSGITRKKPGAPRRNIYIKETPEFEGESQSKKVTFSIGIILILILGVSVIFGIRQKKINETRSQYEGTLTEANKNLDEAIGLVEVSPDRARELFVSAQEKLNEIESFNAKDSRIDELRKKIEEQKSAAFGEYNTQTDLFLDLTLLSSGFKGDRLSASGGNLYVLDKGNKKIVSVEIDSKKSKVVAGPDVVGDILDFTSYADRVFKLDSEGIKEIGGSGEVLIPKDWQGDALLYGFAGNMYVLDKEANQIYRFAGSGDSFGGKQNWLASSTKPDFSSAKSWTIDGAIYVLGENKKVQKFSLGSPQSFSINGVYPEITDVDSIYSNEETEFTYILDSSAKRVVVLDKKGNYKAQYMSDDISDAKDIVVSETDKKIILLTGEKLLSIEMKHL